MTLPFNPSGALPTANDGRGSFVQMGGGYEASIAQANAGRGGPAPLGVPQYGQQLGAQPSGPIYGLPPAPAAPMRGMPGPGSFVGAQQPAGYNQQGQPLYAAPQAPTGPVPGMPPAGWPGSNGPAPLWQGAPAPQAAPQQFWSPPAAPMPQAPVPANLDERLNGPDVPPELQGRSVRELIGIHGGLRQLHLQRLAQGQQAPAAPAQVAQQVASSTPAPQAGQWDWRNPEQAFGRVVDERISRALNEQLAPMLAPMMQQSSIAAINTARSQAIAAVGPQLYAQLEPLINESLQGADPRILQNPQIWTLAAERAVGQLTLRGGMRQQPAAPDPRQPGVYPVQQPGNGQPIPNLPLFFSEQPNQGGPVAGRAQLTDAHRQAAYLMNMTDDQYVAWGGLR